MTFTTQDREHDHPLAGRRLGVVGRVGSGRATLAVLLARGLAKRGYKVCFLDADEEQDDSFRAFGLQSPPGPLAEFLSEEGKTPPSMRIPYGDREIQPPIPIALEDLPESVVGRTDEGILFLSLGGFRPQEPSDGPVPAWIPQDLRITGDREPPVTLLKMEASHQAPSLDFLASLDWVLVVVDPTFSSLELATVMGNRIAQLQKEAPAGTEEMEPVPGGDPQGSDFGAGHHMGLLAVLNRIPDPETEQVFVTAISQRAHVQPIGAIREDWEVSDAGLHGWPVPQHKADARVEKILDRVEESERRALLATRA